MIKAECHSDDRCVEVDFDATPWFEKASNQAILDIEQCGWGGNYPSDDVAIDMANQHSEIKEMFDYIKIRNRRRDRNMMGFECNIDEESAMMWIKENRKELLTLI